MVTGRELNEAISWSTRGEGAEFVSSSTWETLVEQMPPMVNGVQAKMKCLKNMTPGASSTIDFVKNLVSQSGIYSEAARRYYDLNELWEKFPVSPNRVRAFVIAALPFKVGFCSF